jgi:hypothetical protein
MGSSYCCCPDMIAVEMQISYASWVLSARRRTRVSPDQPIDRWCHIGLIARPECGTRVTSHPRDGGARVQAGTLDDTSRLRPTQHIWTRSKQPWITFVEGNQIFEAQAP